MQKALLILNMQNDICHPDGVYHKYGLLAPQATALLPAMSAVIEDCHKKQIPVIGSQTTVLLNLEKNAIGLSSLIKSRPFLDKEGLREGTWGHDLLEDLAPVDYKIKKWGSSAFHQTELEAYLHALRTQEIVLVGFTTNGTVETAAREAIGKHFSITVISDCVASYSEALHRAALSNISSFGRVITSEEWLHW